MTVLLEIARTGFVAILLHPLRSLVTIACLVAVLLPYLACLGLSRGLQEQAEASVRFGADLYVTARQFGRPVPIPLSAVEQVRRLPGVTDVVPRIVGGIVLGKDNENAVLVGMPADHFPSAIRCVEGRLPQPGRANELVVGTELARRLRLEVGSYVPPFYHNAEGDRTSRVVGLFTSDVGIWQGNLIFTSLETAAYIFNEKGTATDLLVWCRPGYEEQVASAIANVPLFPPSSPQGLRPHVTAREDAAALFRAGLMHREGIFSLHFLLAFSVGILVILATSGFGLSERRREIGILKATGWQTDQVLLRSTVESFLLALVAISLSVILAFVWLRGINGFGIAGIFLTGVDMAPGFRVPFRLTGVPVLLAFLIGLTIMLTGTLYSSWRAAIAAPVEAMR
jgi:ABC-type lipoprotein release transport system permease subunit